MAAQKMMIMAVLVVIMVSWTPSGGAQIEASCIQALLPCAQFINATNPPEICCRPLVQAFQKELPCLCSILQNPSLAAAANVNMTQAMELPSKCNITAANDPNICKKASASPTPVAGGPTASASASSPAPEAGAPTTSTLPKGSNAASSVLWTGLVSNLMLLLAGFMLY